MALIVGTDSCVVERAARGTRILLVVLKPCQRALFPLTLSFSSLLHFRHPALTFCFAANSSTHVYTPVLKNARTQIDIHFRSACQTSSETEGDLLTLISLLHPLTIRFPTLWRWHIHWESFSHQNFTFPNLYPAMKYTRAWVGNKVQRAWCTVKRRVTGLESVRPDNAPLVQESQSVMRQLPTSLLNYLGCCLSAWSEILYSSLLSEPCAHFVIWNHVHTWHLLCFVEREKINLLQAADNVSVRLIDKSYPVTNVKTVSLS